MEIRILSSKYQIQNYTVTLNTSLTRPTTRCYLNIPLSHFVSKTNKSKHHESCSFQKQTIFHAANKELSLLCVKEKFRNSFGLPKKYSVRENNNILKPL